MKIGDKVRIKDAIKETETIGIDNEMLQYLGKETVIKDEMMSGAFELYIDEGIFVWAPEWLEKIE